MDKETTTSVTIDRKTFARLDRLAKSTLLNILGILDNYDSGEYYLNDVLIKKIFPKISQDITMAGARLRCGL